MSGTDRTVPVEDVGMKVEVMIIPVATEYIVAEQAGTELPT